MQKRSVEYIRQRGGSERNDITLRQNVWKLKDDGLCILRIRSTRQSDDCCNQHCGTVHHERYLKWVIEKKLRAISSIFTRRESRDKWVPNEAWIRESMCSAGCVLLLRVPGG